MKQKTASNRSARAASGTKSVIKVEDIRTLKAVVRRIGKERLKALLDELETEAPTRHTRKNS